MADLVAVGRLLVGLARRHGIRHQERGYPHRRLDFADDMRKPQRIIHALRTIERIVGNK